MKNIFKPGDKKQYSRIVEVVDTAIFNKEMVHAVYATFSLARDIEWTTRQFVIEMRDDDEEGIGTFLSIDHKAPAFVGEQVNFTAWIDHIEGNELFCFYEAKVGDRLIAIGKTGQKILKAEKIKRIFTKPI